MTARRLLPETLRAHKGYLIVLLLGVAALYAPLAPLLVREWATDPNYSHGFLVPLASAWFLYQRREALAGAQVHPNGWGIVLVAGAMLMLILGYLGAEKFTMRASIVVLFAGLVLFYFGARPLHLLALPIGYLLFMIPIPYVIYDSLALPLKLFVAASSVETLKMMGVAVLREGNIIHFSNVVFEVADACSGLRSIISLVAMAVAYAFLFHPSARDRFVLIVAAVPLAILTNAIRVIVTGVLSQYWGARAAEGFFHEFAGFAVFALAMGLLLVMGSLLKWRRR